jgi:hypothetical protein
MEACILSVNTSCYDSICVFVHDGEQPIARIPFNAYYKGSSDVDLGSIYLTRQGDAEQPLTAR